MRRRRVKHVRSLEQRLKSYATRLREQAQSMPAGEELELLLRKARQHDAAASLDKWLSSSGLRPPK